HRFCRRHRLQQCWTSAAVGVVCYPRPVRSISSYLRTGHALRKLCPPGRADESTYARKISQEDFVCEQRRRSNRNAVKIARAHTGRSGIIAFEDAFHGRTMMTLALTSKTHPY